MHWENKWADLRWASFPASFKTSTSNTASSPGAFPRFVSFRAETTKSFVSLGTVLSTDKFTRGTVISEEQNRWIESYFTKYHSVYHFVIYSFHTLRFQQCLNLSPSATQFSHSFSPSTFFIHMQTTLSLPDLFFPYSIKPIHTSNRFPALYFRYLSLLFIDIHVYASK